MTVYPSLHFIATLPSKLPLPPPPPPPPPPPLSLPSPPLPLAPIVMHLACVTLRMTMEEVLAAATINATAALGISGSLEEGKMADMLILNASRCMGREKTNLIWRAKFILIIGLKCYCGSWSMIYPASPHLSLLFLIFSGWNILYTNSVVMIRSLGTSISL